ncbi:hypothetical protein HanRHA438_Chr09g0378861 [Helianthus annuus]|uniref:Uncharacterized protein n=1 Tax=Helianthus annuus TaxID=4232 RepID=A0A251TT51_HELAN|nr:hypothetical protein HanXRQr2_Chr09g0367721 [Helianthus annuus]KAJ0540899.1 hypothetical protein HanHA89_Chr09g0322171 [Helianthus annuus]KAJ0705998.1 hypothetical protein HanLR1_Chr09g0301861 [Helianthus annuus]KAJ0886394.1 hypothetical protein HanRHA438_Chr09g0378861 [Helianthus annuus]
MFNNQAAPQYARQQQRQREEKYNRVLDFISRFLWACVDIAPKIAKAMMGR